jgi:hypothetical protein
MIFDYICYVQRSRFVLSAHPGEVQFITVQFGAMQQGMNWFETTELKEPKEHMHYTHLKLTTSFKALLLPTCVHTPGR